MPSFFASSFPRPAQHNNSRCLTSRLFIILKELQQPEKNRKFECKQNRMAIVQRMMFLEWDSTMENNNLSHSQEIVTNQLWHY